MLFESDFIPCVRRLEELYISYKQKYVMSVVATRKNPDGAMFVPKDKTGTPLPITNDVLCKHMTRNFAVCVFAGPLSSKFICFDVDDGSAVTVRKVIDGLVDIGFPRERIYVSSSGGKGYHVEMFFTRVMYTEDLRLLYNMVILRQGLDPKKVEFRPTFTQAIKLPLSVHRKTYRRCWYVEQDTLKPIERRDYVLEIQQVDYDEALKLIYAAAAGNTNEIRCCKQSAPGMIPGDKATAHLMSLNYPNMTEAGTRHELMLKIAVLNRYAGLSREECISTLQAWYKRQPEQLISSSPGVVADDIEYIVNWVWSDKFHLSDTAIIKPALIFRQPDVRILLAQTTKTKRRLMFLVIRGTLKYGYMQATQERLAEAIGVARESVARTAKKLEVNGWIKIVKAKAKRHENGAIRGRPSRYYLSGRAAQWASATLDTFVGADDSVMGLAFLTDKVEVPNSEERTWRQDYEAVLRGFCSDDILKNYLTAKELEDLHSEHDDGK